MEVPSDWVVTDCDQSILSMQSPQEYTHVGLKDIVVWVDPLDGTSEYAQGLLEHVTVLIGLSIKGESAGGVIHQPYYNFQNEPDTVGRTIWGLVGLGVGGYTSASPPEGKLIIATTRSHSNALVQEALDALKPDEVLRVGGAGHKVLLLLEGKAHAYVFASKGCKKWDTYGPEAVLTASGGKLTDIHGNPYTYDERVGYPNTRGVLATPKGIDHSSLASKIPQSVRDTLV